MKSIRSHVPAAEHREILYRGVLTGLVGQFEVLIADLAHHFFRRAPGALGGDDKVLSARELLAFASIDEAKEFIISDRVDDLLRGSAEDWRKFFESRMKIDLREISTDWPHFVEHIQRRHLIVHAGSRISRRYLSLVDQSVLKKYFGDPQIGQPVRLDSEYIESALRSFEATGILLGLAFWSKLHREAAEAQAELLIDHVYESVKRGQWNVVLHLAKWGAGHEAFDASSRLVCQINCWLALKRMKRFEECRVVVENLDCSALNARFSVARAALLDDHDSFFAIVDATDGGDLDERAWTEWPLFDELRKHERYPEISAKYLSKAEAGVEIARTRDAMSTEIASSAEESTEALPAKAKRQRKRAT